MKQIYFKPIHRSFFALLVACLFFKAQHISAQTPKPLAEADNCKELNAWLLLGDGKEARLDGQTLYQPELLVQFYALRNCKPVWYDAALKTARIDSLLQILHDADMKKENHVYYIDYTYNEINAFYLPTGLFNYNELYKIDVLLTDAALNYGLQLAFEKQGDEEISNEKTAMLLAKKLDNALKNNQIAQLFQTLHANGLSLEDNATLSNSDLQNARSALDKALSEAEKGTLNDTVPIVPTVVNDSALYKAVRQKGTFRVRNERLSTQTIADAFYAARQYSPAWHNGQSPNPTAQQLLTALQQAPADGLYSGDYHLNTLKQLLNQSTWDNVALSDLDLLLTDAALLFAQHLRLGRLNPRQLTLQWDVRQGSAKFEKELANALAQGQIAPFFDQMRPKQAQYGYLKKALERYRKYAQNSDKWLYQAPPTEALKLGAKGEGVKNLRRRLAAEGYTNLVASEKTDTIVKNIDNDNSVNISEIVGFEGDKAIIVKRTAPQNINESVYDSTLLKAVKTYQRLHVLGADGAAGPKTLENMNIPPKDRLAQIQMALEIWRWLPADLGNRYILVNIPAYMMYLYENKDNIALEKKVCVGKVEHKTPIFSDKMEYLELNPYWTVPQNIAKKEVLPAIKREGSNYLRRNNMKALAGGEPINANTVKWWQLSSSYLPYTFRQEPGQKNALGDVKFLFPNQYNVYLHDTPSKHLFGESTRAYSHGCIRLHKPLELAEYLLRPYGEWDIGRINAVVESRKNTRINLPEPLPVYILYFTAWANDKGEVYFYPDVYGRDKELKRSMGLE